MYSRQLGSRQHHINIKPRDLEIFGFSSKAAEWAASVGRRQLIRSITGSSMNLDSSKRTSAVSIHNVPVRTRPVAWPPVLLLQRKKINK